MHRLPRSSFLFTLTTSMVVLLRVGNVMAGPDGWTWSISPAFGNAASCSIKSCTDLYNKTNLATDALTICFNGTDSTCNFNAIGQPGSTDVPIICAGSKSTTVAALNISGLIPPFGDSVFTNGSATVDLKQKPDGTTQCDFYTYVGKWLPPSNACTKEIDDTYWVPDTANGVMTIMVKRFELSLYKVIEGFSTGYYIENGDWSKCGLYLDKVSLNDKFNVVVSMAGNQGKTTTTTTVPPPKTTTTTGKPTTSTSISNEPSTTTASTLITDVITDSIVPLLTTAPTPTSTLITDVITDSTVPLLTTAPTPTSTLVTTSAPTRTSATTKTHSSLVEGEDGSSTSAGQYAREGSAHSHVRQMSYLGLIVAMIIVAQV